MGMNNQFDVSEYVSSFIRDWEGAKKYEFLLNLMNDSIFDDLVITGINTYKTLFRSFEVYNELFFQLTGGRTRYSCYNSWATNRKKRNDPKKICNSVAQSNTT